MSKEQFSGILSLLIPQLVKEVMIRDNIAEDAAVACVYNSELYSALENQDTALWHLSPKALYSLYHQETQTGQIEYPEET